MKEMFGEILPFSSSNFRKVWEDWTQHRKEVKKPLTETSKKYQLRRLQAMGEQDAIRSIEQSIANGWQGLFPPITYVGREQQEQPGQALINKLKGQ